MKKITVVGTSGITASELINIIKDHPKVEIKYLLSSSLHQTMSEDLIRYYGLSEKVELLDTFAEDTFKKIKSTDLIFLCLPHKVSMEFVSKLIFNSSNLPKIIDLSADFRIKNVILYEKFYECKHLAKGILEKFVYGLPEMYKNKKEEIKQANFIANPGCYPTTVILGLAPMISKFELQDVIIDAKSGYSGGGKKLVEEYEKYGGNNTYPYNVFGKHRHIPEIKEQLSLLANKEVNFLFTPYVVPQYQGMLTTIYVRFQNQQLKVQNLYEIYEEYYKDCVFIKILSVGILPQTRDVLKTNFCEIGFAKEENSNWIKIFVAIDNLIKGAVGQAVQNMNIMFGFEETTGLV